MADLITYLWTRLPLVLMFANGYLIYRLLAVTGLTEVFVFRSLQKGGDNLPLLLLFIITASALLSFFIPNAITVLTLLPVLRTIDRDIGAQVNRPITTALTLSVIYGANIGGMGSLIGSPANLLLIGALDLYNVPGRYQIGFFNWFIWSVPLVILFVLAAWAVVLMLAVPRRNGWFRLRLKGDDHFGQLSPAQRSGLRLFGLFLFFWTTDAILKEAWPLFLRYEPVACLGFLILFSRFAFGKSVGGSPLLSLGDMVQGFPRRGILFLGLLTAVIFGVRFLHLDQKFADGFLTLIRPETPPFALLFTTVITVILLTEFLSNTVISTAFFPIAYFAATAHHIPPLVLMIAVSVASTCAFMTPVATPCNALAFGEMKGTSFFKMLISGLLLNGIGALLMTLWLQFIIPVVYSF